MSDLQRARRVERILSVRERALDAARGELAAAMRGVADAEATVEAAERAYAERADAVANAACVSVGDLAAGYNFLTSLRGSIERAVVAVGEAKRIEAEKREGVREATLEVRKIEKWRDMLEKASREASAHLERKQTDEIAARIATRAT